MVHDKERGVPARRWCLALFVLLLIPESCLPLVASAMRARSRRTRGNEEARHSQPKAEYEAGRRMSQRAEALLQNEHQTRERCQASCKGRLVGGRWGVHNQSSECFVQGMFEPSMADMWDEQGVEGNVKDYCDFYKVDGCVGWRGYERWQVHKNAQAVIETCSRLGLDHIRFAGDSVTSQFYYTFIRTLESARAELPLRVPTTSSYGSPVRMYFQDRFVAASGAELTTSSILIQTPLGNMEWRHRYPELANNFLSHALPCRSPQALAAFMVPGINQTFLRRARSSSPCNPVSALVLNFGLHYQYRKEAPSLSAKEIRDMIVPDHEALLKMLARHPRMRKVYRELTPVHGDGSKLCEPLSNGSTGLTPGGVCGVLSREVLGSNTAKRMREAGFIFLEVFEMLGVRWMDHATRTDCLHWRVPGPINIWVDAMLDALFCGS